MNTMSKKEDEEQLGEEVRLCVESLRVPDGAFEADWILHKMPLHYTPGEWVDKLWWDITRFGGECLDDDKTVALFQELVNSGTLAGFKGKFRQEFARLHNVGKVYIPLCWN